MEGFWFVVPLVMLIFGSVFLAKRCNKKLDSKKPAKLAQKCAQVPKSKPQ